MSLMKRVHEIASLDMYESYRLEAIAFEATSAINEGDEMARIVKACAQVGADAIDASLPAEHRAKVLASVIHHCVTLYDYPTRNI